MQFIEEYYFGLKMVKVTISLGTMNISPRLFKIFELEARKRIFKVLKVVQELFRRDLVCKRKRERKDHEQVQ